MQAVSTSCSRHNYGMHLASNYTPHDLNLNIRDSILNLSR